MNKHKRKIYLRKKDKSYIFESKTKGKTTFIWTIPKDYESFLRKLCKSSFFTKDKANKIMTLLASADYVDVYPQKQAREVRITDTTRNFEKDDLNLDEEIDELVNR